MLLRDSEYKGTADAAKVLRWGKAGRGRDEFEALVKKSEVARQQHGLQAVGRKGHSVGSKDPAERYFG